MTFDYPVLLCLTLCCMWCMVVGMAKEMFSARLDSDLRDALAAEAAGDRRTVSNMLEWILRERYSRALTEGVAAIRQTPREPVAGERVLPAATSAVSAESVPPPVHNQPMQQTARDLAVRDGKCRADTPRGTKCKLCGKVH